MKRMGMGRGGDFVESFQELFYYLQHELPLDVTYLLFRVIGPILIVGIIVHGSLGFLRDVYKLILPPDAREIHRSALAALYHNKRVKKGDQQNCQEAEKLLLKAIAKDDLYFPAYLSLATLYIYRMKLPDKALEILELAKDRGPLSKVEPLLLDAKALKIGGNDIMVQMGGVFAQEEYLSPPSNRYGS